MNYFTSGFLRRSVGYIGIGLIISILALSILAFFITSSNSNTSITYDGLGRRLYQIPSWASILVVGNSWPGLLWHLIDLLVFWGGLVFSYEIMQWGFAEERKNPAYNFN